VIPLRDVNPTTRSAWCVHAIVFANIAVFVYQSMLPEQQLLQFVEHFGVVPRLLVYGPWAMPASLHEVPHQVWFTPFTSMFLHGGFFHLLSNMWFLWVFGDNIEEAFGHVGFIIFYVVSGLAAVAAQVFINPSSTIPMIGASGAISGVLASYMVLYPRHRIVTLIPIFIFIQIVELPAFLFLFLWFAIQLISGVLSLGQTGGGVAFFAHVGGFAAGYILTRFGVIRRAPRGRVRSRYPR